MHEIIKYFEQLTKIPHCSHKTKALETFLVNFATQRGYDTQIDNIGNILISKNDAKICLQAHYDMVCVGKAPQIDTQIVDGWMRAKDSTLGSDNGIGVAMMMALMDEGRACEFLFTNDEEVGLIGANGLNFELKSQYMLNLDSEDEGEVYIGCAGGVDIFAEKTYMHDLCEKQFYEISISNLPGGHSGVQIDENIPNAIKLFAQYCQDKDIKITTIKAGERINSIPANLKAIVASDEILPICENINIEKITKKYETIKNSKDLIYLLCSFSHGVIKMNETLGIPDQSINLAQLSLENGICKISTSARAMDNHDLSKIEKNTRDFFHKFGFDVKSEGKYPAWKPEVNIFSKIVAKEVEKIFNHVSYKAIHAGLECAVISNLYPNIKIASIGPNILSPHSIGECVEIASVLKVYEVVKNVINECE